MCALERSCGACEGENGEKVQKPAEVVDFSLLSTPPTLRVRKANAWLAYSGRNSAISGAVGSEDGKVAVPTTGAQRRTGPRVAIVA